MSAELWAVIGAGIALAGLQWRLYGGLAANLNACTDRIEARLDRVEGRMDHIEAQLTSIKERLWRIEGLVDGHFGDEPAPENSR